MKFCIYLLSCKNRKEAEKIENSLLEKKLIVCSRKIDISSTFLWKNYKNKADEILLLMESYDGNFEKIDTEVKNLHSYDTYVFYSIPIEKTTTAVNDWIKKELK